jgi:hypothetical protein
MADAQSLSPIVQQTLQISGYVEYPLLRKPGQQNVHKFLSDRAAYARKIQERRKQTGQANVSPVSLVFSIDYSLLAS